MKTIYGHGREFSSCEICDKELTFDEPGIRTMYVNNRTQYVTFVCTECFAEPDYQDIIKDLSNKHGMDIRTYPLIND